MSALAPGSPPLPAKDAHCDLLRGALAAIRSREPGSPRSLAELNKAQIDHGFRDLCANLLIPLNACRKQNLYLPWTCEGEKHAYEKCEYDYYMARMKKQVAASGHHG